MTYVSIKDLNDICFNKRPLETYVIEAFYWNICHWGLLLKHMSLRSFIETCVIEVFYWNICHWGLLLKHVCFNGIHQWHVFQLKRPHDMYYKPRSKWHVFQLKTSMTHVSMKDPMTHVSIKDLNDTCFNKRQMKHVALTYFNETHVISLFNCSRVNVFFIWNTCHCGLFNWTKKK
jgi:hypothetical protein